MTDKEQEKKKPSDNQASWGEHDQQMQQDFAKAEKPKRGFDPKEIRK